MLKQITSILSDLEKKKKSPLEGFPGSSAGNPPAMGETWVGSFCWEDPLEEGMGTHFNILAWRIPMDRGVRWAIVHGTARNRM